jgi:hypothetical protein
MGNAGYGTYFFFGSCCFAMFFFVWFLIPETKGMSLERMDDMYVLLLRPSSVIYQEGKALTKTASASRNSQKPTSMRKALMLRRILTRSHITRMSKRRRLM